MNRELELRTLLSTKTSNTIVVASAMGYWDLALKQSVDVFRTSVVKVSPVCRSENGAPLVRSHSGAGSGHTGTTRAVGNPRPPFGTVTMERRASAGRWTFRRLPVRRLDRHPMDMRQTSHPLLPEEPLPDWLLRVALETGPVANHR